MQTFALTEQGSPSRGTQLLALMVLAGITGVVLAVAPVAAVAVPAAVGTIALVVWLAPRLPALFLSGVGLLLVGYAMFGRSVAYLGVPPLFVGELALVAGLVASVVSGRLVSLLRLPQTWCIALLALWGAAQTVPYVRLYGFDALRDATLWGYSAFALAVAACLIATGRLPMLVERYRRWIPWFALWVTVSVIVDSLLGENVPDMPGTGVRLLSLKMGDAGVHLAGAAAFMLAYGHGGHTSEPVPLWRRTTFWATWLIAAACVVSRNRGGFVAVITALSVVAILNPLTIGRRLLAAGALAAILGIPLVLLLSNGRPDAALTDERTISPTQIAANVASVWNNNVDPGLEDTRQWRLDWWKTIARYTFSGPYFWTGKGFGINLADDDGYQVSTEDIAPLRSPHNGHLTMLARAGVPGLALWILLQLLFGGALLRAYLEARRMGAAAWAQLDAWLLAYWAAFLVNASFDVFLEGPQGGIWFWSLVGAGLAALAYQRDGRNRLALGAP